MLTLEYLLEEAKSNGLPILKKRGILREYLQIMALSGIYRQDLGRSMFFTGGTALRFFYNLPRFSEDLDFDTPSLRFKDFLELLGHVKKGLREEGFSPEIITEERENLYVAEIYFKDLMKIYKITDKRGLDMMVKIEAYKPSWKIQPEPGVISLYGYNFSAILLEKGCLFSEKLCAFLKRTRGRDIYDTLFLLKKKFPIDMEVLIANKIIGQPGDIILEHLKGLSAKKLQFLSNQVAPFLFKEDDTELVLNAVSYAEKFL